MSDLVDTLRDGSRPGQMTIRRRAAGEIEELRDEIERLRAMQQGYREEAATLRIENANLRAALAGKEG